MNCSLLIMEPILNHVLLSGLLGYLVVYLNEATAVQTVITSIDWPSLHMAMLFFYTAIVIRYPVR